jgi:hypothetical protein
MGIRRKSLQPVIDPWVDAKYIVQKYTVSPSTALRWIIRLMGDELTRLDGKPDHRRRRGTRPYRMRRIPLSVLEAHIDDLLN